MKVIDLLNKIANGEEVPKKIKINNEIWIYEDNIDYRASDDRGYLFEVNIRTNNEDLNEEVEIIEEDNKDNFTGWKMYQDGKEVCSIGCSTNEEKKIPEKLNIEDDGNTITLYGEKENEWTILDNVDVIICNKINSIIDYLKSKGE